MTIKQTQILVLSLHNYSMDYAAKVNSSRAFWKKAHNYLRYYPLTHKEPFNLLQQTIDKIVRSALSAKTIENLESISENVRKSANVENTDHLCQMAMIEEKRRYILYIPTKLLGIHETTEEIVKLVDIVVVD